jgi:hypothetical protein
MPRLTSLFTDWADLDAAAEPVSAQALADALLRACAELPDEVLRGLPGTPDDAAAALASSPFADRVAGVYLPIQWLESFCAGMRLPIAELESGWDISDGETVYYCPRATLADDADSPQDTRDFVRVDDIRRWES